MKDGLVSIITPVYNAEEFIVQTIESVQAQTYSDWELLLIDDCSTDSSAELIKSFTDNDNRIRYVKLNKNSGAAVTRNTGLAMAKGRYIAFLDSDDIWKPDKIERQLKLMKQKKTPFSYTAIEMIDENSNLIKGKRRVKETCEYKYLLHNTIIATSSVIIDRNVLGDFRMPLRRGGQDYATWLSLLRNGTVACGIDEALVKYRVASGSLSSNKFKSIIQVWEIQTQDEKINKVSAAINVMKFGLNALKKYLI